MTQSLSWARPFTTRRYLHPPFSERMFTVWGEAKIIYGEVVRCVDWRSYDKLACSGLWLLHGNNADKFDYKKVDYETTPDGAPIHRMTHHAGALSIELECFCDVSRKASCHMRIRLYNNEAGLIRETLWLMPRSGYEKQLVFGAPDEYCHYTPDEQIWKTAPCTWYSEGEKLRDGEVFIDVRTTLNTCWDPVRGMLRVEVLLPEGQEAEIILCMGKGECQEFNYFAEKSAAQAYWNRELGRLNKLPEQIRGNEELLKTARALTAQMLQCFCYPVGEEYVLARQGGLQRLIWPIESVPVLEALCRIGDFSTYVESVMELYFRSLQTPDGEVHNIGEDWASITGGVIYSFGVYAHTQGREVFDRYKDAVYSAFGWIEKTRNTTRNMPGCAEGLFPPLRSCDWFQVFQGWTMTDVWNLLGYQKLIAVFEMYGDPRAEEIRSAHQDYIRCMRACYAKVREKYEGSEVLRIPITPDGDDEALVREAYPELNFARFLLAGIPEESGDYERVWNYLLQSGRIQNGLTGRFFDNEEKPTHVWYTSYMDSDWIQVWIRMNRKDRAEEILGAQLYYSMTAQYYMIERYMDNDPYYVPWSPNASANGRTLLSLMDYADAFGSVPGVAR